MSDARTAECRKKCWWVAAAAGVVLAVLLMAMVNHGFLRAAIFGLIAFGLLGYFLPWAFCTGEGAASVPSDVAKPAVTSRPEPVTSATPVATPPSAPAASAPAAMAVSEPVAADRGPVPATTAKTPAATPKPAKAKADATPAKPAAKSGSAAKTPAKPSDKAAPKTAAKAKAKVSADAPAKPARAAATGKLAAVPAKPAGATASTLDAALAKSKDAPETGEPEMLARPRGGKADDLKLIKGVGPALERILNDAGVWHFDQIASWKARDIAFVDAKMQRFSGRISRDEWVKQAKVLAKGGKTEFSERAAKGGMY